MKKLGLLLFSLFFTACLYAQISIKDTNLTLEGLVDIYYLYNFNQPNVNDHNPYAFAYHRHDELNLNIGLITLRYDNDKVRANLGLQAGTYPNANYSAEPATLQNINEANVGVKLTQGLWFDAGVMPSHIGVESYDATGCFNVTRSLMADGSPYFLTAAKLTYTPSDKLTAAALVTNGWQNIQETNDKKAVGLQLTYQLSDKVKVNYSNFFGQERPNTDYWFFSDFWVAVEEIIPGLNITAVGDLMLEKHKLFGQRQMFTAALLTYYRREKMGLGARLETYQDPDQVVVSTPIANPFVVNGFSFNIDRYITEKAMLRFETRYLGGNSAIFPDQIWQVGDALPALSTYRSNAVFSVLALQVKF